MTTRFCVTRQTQYPDGDLCVEISSGDFNYTNPRQIGHVEEFSLALEAVEYAIDIAKQWQGSGNCPLLGGSSNSGV